MALDLQQTANSVALLIGGACIASLGFLLRRKITGAKSQEKATLYSQATDVAAKMRANGLSHDEVQAVEALFRSEARGRAVPEQPQSEITEPTTAEMAYWSQTAMNLRAGAALRTSEATLDEVLTDLMALVGEEGQSELFAAQDAWKSYRDLHAAWVASKWEGGTAQPLIRASEARSLTEQRSALLREIVKERLAR